MKNAIPFQLMLIATSLILLIYLGLHRNPPVEEETVMVVETEGGVVTIRPVRGMVAETEEEDEGAQEQAPATAVPVAPPRRVEAPPRRMPPPGPRPDLMETNYQRFETNYNASETIY